MPVPSPRTVAIGLTHEQRELVVTGVLDFDEAHALPKGLFDLECWWNWAQNCKHMS